MAPGRFELRLTIDGDTHEMMRHAQALLGHQVPTGDLAEVLKRALVVYVGHLEKRKCARTDTPRPHRRWGDGNPRHIPAHVKRAVWQRDEGRCTFVGTGGRRCSARRFLEYDHVVPVVRGGEATVDGVRLRCRAHNQYGAECVFGAAFMKQKRDAARSGGSGRAGPDSGDEDADVTAALRSLGFSAREARRAIEDCETEPGAVLEERVRAALRLLGAGGRHRGVMRQSLHV